MVLLLLAVLELDAACNSTPVGTLMTIEDDVFRIPPVTSTTAAVVIPEDVVIIFLLTSIMTYVIIRFRYTNYRAIAYMSRSDTAAQAHGEKAALITLMAVFIAAVWRMLLQRVGGRRQNLYPSAISNNSVPPGAAMKKEDPDIKEEADGSDEGPTSDGPNIAASVSNPSAIKQSALFHAPMRRWFPRDGDGDAQQPGSWQYVVDWDIDLNPIELLPKYTVLSNVVMWMVWTSEKFSAAEMATYWPLDFDVVEGHAVLLNTRRPRGRSKIMNSEWAKLPFWKDLEVNLEPISPNNQWGKSGYDFDQRVAHTILTLLHTTSTLPDMDDNTLFLNWNTYLAPHPELSVAFSNNKRFLSD
ncbi:hypothetical protein IWZ00DRAFT_541237 [Phyllosticta capitalensis]